MKISEIIKFERGKERDISIARLYLENGWYRAYETSALFVHQYPNNLENNRLKPTNKYVKEVDDNVISVGLKLNMMDKFLPNSEREMHDGYMDVKVNVSNYLENGESLEDKLSKWKESVPVVKPNSVGKVYSNPLSMTSIVKDILTYRMEHTTADEDRDFLYALKEKCYSLI